MTYAATVKAWEAERDRAKREKQRNMVKKPKVNGIEKLIPQLKKVVQDSDEEDGEEVQDEEVDHRSAVED